MLRAPAHTATAHTARLRAALHSSKSWSPWRAVREPPHPICVTGQGHGGGGVGGGGSTAPLPRWLGVRSDRSPSLGRPPARDRRRGIQTPGGSRRRQRWRSSSRPPATTSDAMQPLTIFARNDLEQRCRFYELLSTRSCQLLQNFAVHAFSFRGNSLPGQGRPRSPTRRKA